MQEKKNCSILMLLCLSPQSPCNFSLIMQFMSKVLCSIWQKGVENGFWPNVPHCMRAYAYMESCNSSISADTL